MTAIGRKLPLESATLMRNERPLPVRADIEPGRVTAFRLIATARLYFR